MLGAARLLVRHERGERENLTWTQTIHLNLGGLLFSNPQLAGVHRGCRNRVFSARPRNEPTPKPQLQPGPVPWMKPGLRPLRVGSSQLWATLSSQTKQPNILPILRIFIVSLPKSGDF